MTNFIEIDWQPIARLSTSSIGLHHIRHCTSLEDVEGLIEDRIHQEMRERTAAQVDPGRLREAAGRLLAMRGKYQGAEYQVSSGDAAPFVLTQLTSVSD